MLCLKAEALGNKKICSPLNISLQKKMQKGPSSDGGSATCSDFEDVQSSDGGNGAIKDERASCYRSHLEQEVRILQKHLQEEIDLHVALANAVGLNRKPLLSPSKIPDKAQDLLANITALEITVTKLEKELASLHFRLSHERSERLLAETHLKHTPIPASGRPSCSSGFMWEEKLSSLRVAKFGRHQISPSMPSYLSYSNEYSKSMEVDRLSRKCTTEKISGWCSTSKEESEIDDFLYKFDRMNPKKNLILKNLWQHPNKLSEEMVRCMRDIFLCLSESSSIAKASSSSDPSCSSLSPVGHLSRSSLTSFSDSSIMPTTELHQDFEDFDCENIGSYGLAAEVCWMSVGKEQLDYAAEALKKFRFLVEQLTEVNPAQMTSSEKLAFWVNLYNALIMHAYLAYGVPRSDVKLFSLMQKACYTVGGQSFNAVDIEFILLKMKPPTHRPQLGLVLALHKFKISEEHRKYSIDSPEPLVVFALSSGMYSSPAVRIFTPENIHDELKKSMEDYIRASIGINDRGKLLVPELLHCFARNVVEDSLLVDWICRYLTPDQVTVVRDSASQNKQRLLGVRTFSVVPFDSRFRYIFLPEKRI